MAEKGSCQEKQQEEECPELEETQQVTDFSQGRVVTSSGRLRPATILSMESGYHEDTWETEQPFQAITKMKEKMYHLCGSLAEFEEVMQMAMTVHNEGRREGRKEALGEVEQQQLAHHQIREEMNQFLQNTLERWEKLHQTLTTLMPMVSGDAAMRGRHHPRPSESTVFSQQPVSTTRQFSGESTTLSLKEGVAWRRQQRTMSLSAEPVSSTSSCSGETRFDTADEWREDPQPNTTPKPWQGRYLSSSDEECKCKASGLELHPRKLLASEKKKGKK